MSKQIDALKLAEEALVEYRDNQHIKAPRKALAAIREALAECKPAPDGRVPKTVFTLEDIGKAFEQGRSSMQCEMEALAEPVKQEPVAWMVTSEGLDGTPKTYPITGRYKDVRDVCDFGDPVPLYAAPVDAKAIRAEALEEAAKWFETNGANTMIKSECAVAIRGLK